MTELTLDTYPGPLPPFARSLGPRNSPKIALVGEALGEQEDITGAPFSGASGQELTKMLREAGINRSECFLTNTFAFRPLKNNLDLFCVKKAEAGHPYHMPLYSQGKYFHPKIFGELERLRTEIELVKPNLVIALGNAACWSMLSRAGISAIRGTTAISGLVPGQKVLPTFHPAYVLRNWAGRPIVLQDFHKAEREAQFPEIRRPERWILINPTLAEIAEWFSRPTQIYSVDIETSMKQITMIGFARSISDSIVIPFIDKTKPGYNYWPTHSDERAAWKLVRAVLEGPIPLLWQNGVYDLQYLARMGFKPKNNLHDTMLLHHALYPEMKKGLGFLGSIYTNESSWKLMRHNDSNKRDE